MVNMRSMIRNDGPAEGSLEAPLTALANLQRQGLVRDIGLSNVTPAQVVEGRRICEIVCVQNLYNVIQRDDHALIDELAVEPQEVVLGQIETADGRFGSDTAMGPMPIVAMEPSGQFGCAFV